MDGCEQKRFTFRIPCGKVPPRTFQTGSGLPEQCSRTITLWHVQMDVRANWVRARNAGEATRTIQPPKGEEEGGIALGKGRANGTFLK